MSARSTTTDRPIRIASVGYGDIARRRHFPDLAALGSRARLVAIAGRDARMLEACAREHGHPDCHQDVDEMLAREDVDAVLVLTPPDSHAVVARKAIEAGKHVMIEKPMVMSVAEASELLDALTAQQTRRPITCMPLPHVDTAEHHAVARLLADGAIGEPTSVECHRGHRGPTHADWFYRRERAGGGVLFDLGIYQLTAVVSLLGPAQQVTALCTRRFDTRAMDDGTTVEPDVEDSALVSLWLDARIGVTLNATWNGYLSHHATRKRVTVIGREGCVHFGVADGGVYVHRADGDYRRLGAASEAAWFDGHDCRRISPREGSGGPATSIVADFVSRIERGDTSPRPLAMQVHVAEIVFEAYRASAAGEARALQTRF